MKESRYSPIENNLKSILDQLDSHIWTIEELFIALKGKGYPSLVILFSLPFCQPIQIPGFSTPFGVILIFIGLRMIFGRHMWWPKWILKQKISTKLLKIVAEKSLHFFQFLRPFIYPRWCWLCNEKFYYLHGGFVVTMGIYLALPLPIPLSNLLAAWALVLVGLGLVEEDGLFICFGYILGCMAILALGFIVVWLHYWAIT